MYKPGLVSVTMRKLSPKEILSLMAQTELRAIEWGGDVHVPNEQTAVEVRKMTEDSGIAIASYGSYYHCGEEEDFGVVLRTAEALGAPNIRVWAGDKGSLEADEAYRAKVACDARLITAMAMSEGLTVAFEFHGGTLTDTTKSTATLMKEAETAGLYTYWQPPVGSRVEGNLETIGELAPLISNVHCFEWKMVDGTCVRRPFAEGLPHWGAYFQKLHEAGKSGYALMEFVRDDDPAQLVEDAAALCGLLRGDN